MTIWTSEVSLKQTEDKLELTPNLLEKSWNKRRWLRNLEREDYLHDKRSWDCLRIAKYGASLFELSTVGAKLWWIGFKEQILPQEQREQEQLNLCEQLLKLLVKIVVALELVPISRKFLALCGLFKCFEA